MRPIPAIAAQQCGAFTTRQARHAGWTSHALRHAADHGYLSRLRPGVYAEALDGAAPVDLLRLRAAAYSLANRRVPVSHAASAALQGVHLLQVPEHVCVAWPRGYRGAATGTHRHRGVLRPGDVLQRGALRYTAPARTCIELGREHGADSAIVAADHALRLGLTGTAELGRAAEAVAGWPGSAAARSAVLLGDGSAESPLESISRLRIDTAGLPAPRIQVPVTDAHGRFVGRPDFYWEEFGVIGEADGLMKYDGAAGSLIDEKRRQGLLEDLGLIVVRWGWVDLADFARVAGRLRAAFARGCRPDRAPRLWRTAWPHAGAAS